MKPLEIWERLIVTSRIREKTGCVYFKSESSGDSFYVYYDHQHEMVRYIPDSNSPYVPGLDEMLDFTLSDKVDIRYGKYDKYIYDN